MNSLQRYNSANLPELMKIINRNGIGMDEYLNRFFNDDYSSNYPPYNLISLNNHESKLEIALAGFKKKDVTVYTEYGRLIVEGNREEKEEPENYTHRGLAQRSFTRQWTLSDDTKVEDVKFEDGMLTIKLGKVVPEHHAKKEYL
jgi:HSP20 family molecular chaperone IbpA